VYLKRSADYQKARSGHHVEEDDFHDDNAPALLHDTRYTPTKLHQHPHKLTPHLSDAAISFLRDHFQMIDLNPLVINRQRLPIPPAEASPEEMHAHWYQITDKISYMPGVSSAVSYNACMHDLTDGLQTHTFAPAGVEIRGRWTIGGGALPGEGRTNPSELGMDVPRHGLYLMETTELRCNFLMTGFIKKNLKGAHAKVVEKIVDIAREREPKPPVPAKDPSYHSRGPSQASVGVGKAALDQRRPSYEASSDQTGTTPERRKFTPEYERYRQSQDAQSFGRQTGSELDSGTAVSQEPFQSTGVSPPLHVAELPSEPAKRPVSELP
jgi:hypothetical protein